MCTFKKENMNTIEIFSTLCVMKAILFNEQSLYKLDEKCLITCSFHEKIEHWS